MPTIRKRPRCSSACSACKGVLTWRLETEYHERLTQAHKHLRELNDDVAVLTAQYDAFVRARQAATHSYVGYDVPINRSAQRVSARRCSGWTR